MVDPLDADQVADALCEELALAAPGARATLTVAPVRATGATSTWVWFVEPRGHGLPEHLSGRLVLRIHGRGLAEVAEREYRLGGHLAEVGYPSPAPVLRGSGSGPLGHPFVLQEVVPGRPAVVEGARRPWAVRAIIRAVGELEGRLHRLPAPPASVGLPGARGDVPSAVAYLEEDLCRRAERLGGTGPWRDSLDWLLDTAQDHPDSRRVLCHGDLHPLNVLVDGSGRSRRLGVVDWTDARIADPHLDVARSMAILWLGGELAPRPSLRPPLRALARRARRWHLAAWQERTGWKADRDTLDWWEAAHVVRGWLQVEELAAHAVDGPANDTRDALTAGLGGRLAGRAGELRALLE